MLIAVVVALILSVGWAINDWPRLGHMLLPDTDDMMRLAQVRDWLAGQGINDWTQYRLAPPTGAPMHWSRVNDFGIAGLIIAATPFVGRANAELVAVLAYPGLLFAAALFLSARIGRRLWGAEGGLIAAILTAICYPGTTIFVPGRIDHHALQVVLIQMFVISLMRAPGLTSGIVAGVATALSLIVGLETVPQIAALIAVLSGFWVAYGLVERTRLAGFAAALALTTGFFLMFLRPTLWTPAYCDAFTPASSTGMLLAAAACAALAAATPRLTTWVARLAAGATLGALVLGVTAIAYPSCLAGPYGAVDPFLLRAYIPFIEEARGLFSQPQLSRVAAIGGMVAVACFAGAWLMFRERERRPLLVPVVSVVLVSGLVTLFQVRGAYIGAPLAAPLLAGLVISARRRTAWKTPAVIAAWLAGAGVAWAAIPERIERAFRVAPTGIDRPKPQAACSVGNTWEQVDRLPPGVTMAATSIAADIIGATHLSTVGASYHRNNRGNMAMYRFFLSSPDRSLVIAHEWKTKYVAFCPGDFNEIHVTRAYPDSLATRLAIGRVPDWLVPVPLAGTPLRFYRVTR